MNEIQRVAAEIDRESGKSSTRKAQYTSRSAFSDWIRTPTELDSKKGFRNYDIDNIWWLKDKGLWMRIEEKTRNGSMTPDQKMIFAHIHTSTDDQVGYKGFHLLVFSNTTPDNGETFLDGKKISREDLIGFFEFAKPDSWYETTIFTDTSQ